MYKEINIGKVAYENTRKINMVTLEVELKEKSNTIDFETLLPIEKAVVFTASGGFWNSKQTDYVSCGQCVDEIALFFKSNKMVQRIYEIWKQYHLNDFKAGTKPQVQAIEKWKSDGNEYDYKTACEYLKSIGLYYDRGIVYGEQWLTEQIPTDIIAEIKAIIE